MPDVGELFGYGATARGLCLGPRPVLRDGSGAFGNIKATTPLGSNSNNEFGWTAGAGIEYALAQNWTAKVEYLYVSLQNGSCSTAVCGGGSPTVSLNENIARAGVNYKFSF